MKMNGTTIGWLIGSFVWCIFMGVTAISIGFGAMYPPMNYVAKPFVCPNGQLNFQQSVSNPLPGTTYTTTGWSCRNPGADTSTEIDPLKMGLYAGPIYGLLLYVAGVFFWFVLATWSAETLVGKVVRVGLTWMGILALAFIIIFPLWPVINDFIPGATPTPDVVSFTTEVPTVAAPTPDVVSFTTEVPTVAVPTFEAPLPPAAGHPTLASIAQSKSLFSSSNAVFVDTLAREQYLPSDYARPGTLTFTVPLELGRYQLIWRYGWCATTSAILADNLQRIQVKFTLDGEAVPLGDFALADHQANSGEQCHDWYIALGPWPVGLHNLTTRITFTAALNDGNADYPAGDYVHEYTVSVPH